MTAEEGERTARAEERRKRRVKARRRVRDVAYALAVTAVCIAVTVAIGAKMRIVDSASLAARDIVWASLFYLSVIVGAGWFFCILTPFVRNRMLSALCFMGLFVWGCVLYFYYPVDKYDHVRGTPASPAVAVQPAGKAAATTRMDVIRRQIESPNRTLAAFFPSRGGFEALSNARAELSYFIFHTLVIFYVAVLTFAIFGRGLVNRLRKWVTPWRTLNVFWGRSDAGLILARSILESTSEDRVFFALQQRSGDGDEWRTVTKDIDQMGATWSFTYDSNAVESDVSRDSLAQTKGRRHFFMDPSVHVNLSRADRLVKVLREKRPGRNLRGMLAAFRGGVLRWWAGGCREKPFFYVRVDASADELVCLEWAANVRDMVVPILVREATLIAKDFIAKHPLVQMPGVEVDTRRALVSAGELRTLILGFGSCGQELLSEIVCNGQFLSADGDGKVPVPFSVDVVEQDKKVTEEYCLRHPLVGQKFNVNFINGVRVEDKSFDDWFKECLTHYNRIIVCLKGDERSLSMATKVVEFSRRHGVIVGPGVVFARVTDPARHRYMPRGKKRGIYSRGIDTEERIALFGDLKEIYSFKRIDAEAVDKMAKVLNSRHGDFGREVSDAEQMERDWDAASMFDQLSSRAAAEGQRNLLQLLGWRHASADSGGVEVTRERFKAMTATGSDVLSTLAAVEHMRWNAFHLMRGYRPWDVLREGDARTDLPGPRPKKIRANQLATIGKHADIVPFDRLPDVDMRLKEWNTGESGFNRDDFVGLKPDASQAWDIAFCQIMDRVAHAAGLRIVEAQEPRGRSASSERID